MNRKSWKQSYKKYGINKIRRQRTKLAEGKSMQRKPTIRKKRRDTI